MRKSIVVLLSVLLVAMNCMYVSAAPVYEPTDSEPAIVDEETSEENSIEDVSEEERSEEEELSIEEPSEEILIEDLETDTVESELLTEGDVEINEENFPDPVFRQLVKDIYDRDYNDILDKSESELNAYCDMSYLEITDLKGIEYFTNMTYLIINNNKLTTLNLSKNTNLKKLECKNNQLTTLDLSNNTKLQRIDCTNNQLSSLKLGDNVELTELLCSGNQLTALDLQKNTSLFYLECNHNNLSSLLIGENKRTNSIHCDGNQLKKLDVSGVSNLVQLWCGGNQLSSINVDNNAALEVLDCSRNQIELLDVSNNSNLRSLWCYDNLLFALDVSYNLKLSNLCCYNNQLFALDVSQNVELAALDCNVNYISKLNLINNSKLYKISCSRNQLTVLNIAKDAPVQYLYCDNNRLKSVDISYFQILLQIYKMGRKNTASYAIVGFDSKTFYEYSDNNITYFRVDTDTEVITSKNNVSEVFEDIDSSSWYVNAIQYVYENGIMAGKGQAFKPNANIRREEFTQVLYSIEGKPAVETKNPFSDVMNGWYTNSVLWAYQSGIANGKGNGTFGLGNPITRQDLALMLYQYANMKRFDMSYDDSSTTGYIDTKGVSKYAEVPMKWAVSQGIISGKGAKGETDKAKLRLDPAGRATRAECAAMIMKLLQANQ